MKTAFKFLSLFLAILILPSFIHFKLHDGYKKYELKQNETIEFTDKQKDTSEYSDKRKVVTKTISGSFSRGSYDSSSYVIRYDKDGNLNLKEIRGCSGKHQNEISLKLCSGTISRNNDTLRINAKTSFNMIYIFNIQKNGIVDSFISDIQVEIVSSTLENNYCPSIVTSGLEYSGGVTDIVALPINISEDEIYKPFHEDKTIGIFTYFAVKDSKGKSKFYPPNDYVIIGGKSLNISR
jgi:hypothetical protein